MISDFLILIICFLGIYVGLLIGWMAKEELKQGKKYFVILLKSLFVLIIFFIFYELGLEILAYISLVVIGLLLFSLKESYEQLLFYASAILLFISLIYDSLIVPGLVFLMGFPIGTLYLYKKKKKAWLLIKGLFIEYYWFLIIIVVLMAIKIIFIN